MKKTALVIGAAGICLAGVAAPAAVAQTRTPHAKSHLVAKASPSKNVKPYTTVTVKATHALKSADYICIQTIARTNGKNTITNLSKGAANTQSVLFPKSNAKGKLTCKQLFVPFKGTAGKKTHHCPTTKADRKAGWGCGVALVDSKTQGKKSFAIAMFGTKK